MNIHDRAKTDYLAQHDEEFRKMVVAMCIKDPVFFINAFCWTFNPMKQGKDCWKPFLLFPKQEEYVRWAVACIESGNDFGVEKSREVGATWLALAIIAWYWLFTTGFTAKVGSYNADKVYKRGDKATHYWKLQFLIDTLPDWLKPEGWDASKHITELSMVHPTNQSVITGSAPTSDFGRGDRMKLMLYDELQAWLQGKDAWDAGASTTNCRIATGTPNGMNFYGGLMNPAEGMPKLRKFIIDWRDDPRKNDWYAYDTKPGTADIDDETGLLNAEFLAKAALWGRGHGWAKGSSGTNARIDNIPDGQKIVEVRGFVFYPWYSFQLVRKFLGDQATLSQEVDRDYRRSVRGRVYETFQYAKKGRYLYDYKLPTYCGWDFGLDTTAIVWVQYDERVQRYYVIDYIGVPGKLIEWFVPFITGNLPSGDPQEYSQYEKDKIASHKDWIVHGHFGDPSGEANSQVSDYTLIETLAQFGIDVHTNPSAKSIAIRIRATKPILMRTCVDTENCAVWITSMENYRWPDRPEGSQSTGVLKNPVHNIHSHGATAWEYFCVNNPHSDDRLNGFQGPGVGGRDGVIRNSREYQDDHPVNKGITGYGF